MHLQEMLTDHLSDLNYWLTNVSDTILIDIYRKLGGKNTSLMRKTFQKSNNTFTMPQSKSMCVYFVTNSLFFGCVQLIVMQLLRQRKNISFRQYSMNQKQSASKLLPLQLRKSEISCFCHMSVLSMIEFILGF